jgi:hypothetical protein
LMPKFDPVTLQWRLTCFCIHQAVRNQISWGMVLQFWRSRSLPGAAFQRNWVQAEGEPYHFLQLAFRNVLGFIEQNLSTERPYSLAGQHLLEPRWHTNWACRSKSRTPREERGTFLLRTLSSWT